MTDTREPATRSPEDKQLAEELVERAKSDGVELVGPDGLLSGLTKNVLEAGLEAEMSEHLGYDKHDPAGRNKANSRNGTRAKKLLTDVGPVDIEVPRDRDGSFEPKLVVQTCVLHLIRNTFRFASKADWDQIARELRPVYTAVSEHDAKEQFGEFTETWGEKYPAIIRLWENAWAEFAPFLDYSPQIRKVIYSTNAVESLHARVRRATRARGHFPTEQAALKCLYLTLSCEVWTPPAREGNAG